MAWIPSTELPSGLSGRSHCVVWRTSTKTAEVKKEEVREDWPAESRKKQGWPDDVPPCSSQLPYLYQRVLFLGALELGPPHTVVIPWSEQFADNVNSHPPSSWLATSAFIMQRGRGESIADKENRRSRCRWWFVGPSCVVAPSAPLTGRDCRRT